MKFKAPWFESGNEVDLPDMKVEGSLEVAELTKKYVDDFLPFITAVQDESMLRMRVNALAVVSTEQVTDEQIDTAKAILVVYKVKPSDDVEELKKQCLNVLSKIAADLLQCTKKTVRVTVEAAPFFTKRSLLEAYYMMKAYFWDKAKKEGGKPKMPFTQDDLKSLIADIELSAFTAHSMSKLKSQAENKADAEKIPDEPDEIKKKWPNTPEV